MVKRLKRVADYVNTLSDDVEKLSDAELRAKTDEFKKRYSDGEDLDDLMPEAFAVAREAAWRVLDQRPYDVQVMGGAALHFGNVAEMKTGEGKTLTCVLPAYLNALSGKGVHVITVNDYLAKRDSEWMGRVHRLLGLDVGVILAQMTPDQRRVAYNADITYGTNNEFGFDYLRDNMAHTVEEMVQRGHAFGIVDEVDSILIDEARTPLIISGPADGSSNWYSEFARLAPLMEKDKHYEVDLRKRTIATDFATEADLEAERAILGVIRAGRPDDAVIGEEYGASGQAERTWLVDPLCGTLNFAAQNPMFSVNVALRSPDGDVAAVAQPLSGEIFWTDGTAVFIRRDGVDTSVVPSATSRMVDIDIDAPNGAHFLGAQLLTDEKLREAFALRVFSTTLALAWVAVGRQAGYITDGSLRDSVHYTAGIILCRAAGATITDFHGDPLHTASGLIVAATPEAHQRLLESSRHT